MPTDATRVHSASFSRSTLIKYTTRPHDLSSPALHAAPSVLSVSVGVTTGGSGMSLRASHGVETFTAVAGGAMSLGVAQAERSNMEADIETIKNLLACILGILSAWYIVWLWRG